VSVSNVGVGTSTDVSGGATVYGLISRDAGRGNEVLGTSTLKNENDEPGRVYFKERWYRRASPRSRDSGKSIRQVPLAICAFALAAEVLLQNDVEATAP
jgi:hypothetical protein